MSLRITVLVELYTQIDVPINVTSRLALCLSLERAAGVTDEVDGGISLRLSLVPHDLARLAEQYYLALNGRVVSRSASFSLRIDESVP